MSWWRRLLGAPGPPPAAGAAGAAGPGPAPLARAPDGPTANSPSAGRGDGIVGSTLPIARPAGPRTVPVTPGRLREAVESRGYVVREEPDASLTGLWDGYRFRLRLTGNGQDHLSVLGTWGRTVPEALGSPVAQAVNDWNRDRVWPTVFTVEEGGERTVRTELIVDVGAGATDAQLAELVEVGLSAGVQFFRALGSALPAPEEPSPEL